METESTPRPEAHPEPEFTLTLDGNGLKIDRKVDAATAATIVGLVLGTGSGSGGFGGPDMPVRARRGGVPTSGGLRVSVGEFITQHEVKTQTDRIVAFGIYLYDHRGIETFTRDDIRAMYKEAGEAAPGNFPRDFAKAVRSKCIAPHAAGEFYVTKTGRQTLDNHFPWGVTAKSVTGKRRKRAAAPASADEDAAE